MQEHVRRVLSSLRPDAERAGVGLDLFFVDEDFAVVEVLVTGPRAGEFRERVESLLLREAPGLRRVEFLDRPPAEPAPPAHNDGADAAGAALALDIVAQVVSLLEADAAQARLRRPRDVGSFIDGPYRAWIDEARRVQGELEAVPPRSRRGRLKEIFAAVDRTARALRRTLDLEAAGWDEDERPPACVAPPAREEFAQAARILEDLRPRLGDSTLAGFAAGEETSSGGDAAGPTTSLLDRIFKDAAAGRIRDVYIEAGEAHAVLQYRRGRRIERILEFPKTFYASLVARLKKLARLDVADRAHKQEGLITFTAASGYRGLKVEVQTIPDAGGERVHLRLRLPARREAAR